MYTTLGRIGLNCGNCFGRTWAQQEPWQAGMSKWMQCTSHTQKNSTTQLEHMQHMATMVLIAPTSSLR
jgi:hypothetical protein